jgi:hypothetical protein
MFACPSHRLDWFNPWHLPHLWYRTHVNEILDHAGISTKVAWTARLVVRVIFSRNIVVWCQTALNPSTTRLMLPFHCKPMMITAHQYLGWEGFNCSSSFLNRESYQFDGNKILGRGFGRINTSQRIAYCPKWKYHKILNVVGLNRIYTMVCYTTLLLKILRVFSSPQLSLSIVRDIVSIIFHCNVICRAECLWAC